MIGEPSERNRREQEINPREFEYEAETNQFDGYISLDITLDIDDEDNYAHLRGILVEDSDHEAKTGLVDPDEDDFYIEHIEVSGDKVEGQNFSTELFRQLLIQLTENDEFSQAQNLVGYVEHPAEIVNRDKFFGIENLDFKKMNWSREDGGWEDTESEKKEIKEKIRKDEELEINTYKIEVELEKLKDGWRKLNNS